VHDISEIDSSEVHPFIFIPFIYDRVPRNIAFALIRSILAVDDFINECGRKFGPLSYHTLGVVK
jgi:hypothetical protein